MRRLLVLSILLLLFPSLCPASRTEVNRNAEENRPTAEAVGSDTTQKTVGVPILMDIPLFGHLFKRKVPVPLSETNNKSVISKGTGTTQSSTQGDFISKIQSMSSEEDDLNIEFIKNPLWIDRTTDAVAVIVGNKNYRDAGKDVPNVDFAHNDANLMKQFVVKSLGYREGNIIDLRDATQADLISVFGNKDNYKGQLFSWIRPNESDVFVYYSGHGAPSLNDGQGYLLPVNANPNTVELNGYPLETLYVNLGKLPAKSITVVVDACFSGSSQAGSVVKNASSISLKRVDTKAVIPNATILTAAGISEVASWDENAKLGLFTRHFLEGVTGKADQDKFGNGDGQVTLGELKNYLENEVTYMARRLFNREQHPQVSGKPEKVMTVTN